MNIREYFFKIYWIVEKTIIPTLKYSQILYEDILKSHISCDTKWLDIGCGHQILPEWRSLEEKRIARKCKFIVGIDYDLHSLVNHNNISFKVKGSITKLPFKDNYFDLITANMVVEHLDSPDVQFKEVWRILKKDGVFIFHTPNVYGYTASISRLLPKMIKNKLIYFLQKRKDEDVFDTYYRINSMKKIKRLSEVIGFKIVKIKMIVSSAQLIVIPPLVILELILIKILMTNPFRFFRTNIIAILKKPQSLR